MRICVLLLVLGITLGLPGGLRAQGDLGTNAFDIYRISRVLSDRGTYTLVPKGAVLHVPEGLESKLRREKGARYLSLEQFMRSNFVWVHRFPVTVSEATGASPIDSTRLENIQHLGKIVIAVHKGEPVSVKQVKAHKPLAKVEK